MNVYEKLQACRVKLQRMNIKKSGANKFSGYDYFELGDFLPHINELFSEFKLTSKVTFDKDMATLTIINIEKPDEIIEFTSPMATAKLKGCHEIQNLGAVQTYQRRYLYMTALEIVDHDVIDATTGETAISEAQVKRAFAIGQKNGITPAQIKQVLMKDYKKTKVEDLTLEEYNELCERLENAKKGA